MTKAQRRFKAQIPMGYVTVCWDKDLAKFFLRMVATAEEGLRSDARSLWQEAKELHLIFCSIFRK